MPDPPQSASSTGHQSRKLSKFEIATLALALPRAILALLQLEDTHLSVHIAKWGLAPAAKDSAVIGGLGCAVALTRRMSNRGCRCRPLGFLARYKLKSVDAPTALHRADDSRLL